MGGEQLRRTHVPVSGYRIFDNLLRVIQRLAVAVSAVLLKPQKTIGSSDNPFSAMNSRVKRSVSSHSPADSRSSRWSKRRLKTGALTGNWSLKARLLSSRLALSNSLRRAFSPSATSSSIQTSASVPGPSHLLRLNASVHRNGFGRWAVIAERSPRPASGRRKHT